MPDAICADSSERLPWLENAARPAKLERQASWTPLLLSALAGGAIVAGAWAWMGSDPAPSPAPSRSSSTVSLPAPSATQRAAAEPGTVSAAERDALRPDLAPNPEPLVRDSEQQAKPQTRGEPQAGGTRREMAGTRGRAARPAANGDSGAAGSSVVAPKSQTARLWPARQVNGSAGRLIQVGAFASRRQAKLGWRRMERAYPAVGRLPAVVVEARNSKGRRFYRFQIGTTSHAHSEVLCQRMQTMNFSCAVLGLPWKAKIER